MAGLFGTALETKPGRGSGFEPGSFQGRFRIVERRADSKYGMMI